MGRTPPSGRGPRPGSPVLLRGIQARFAPATLARRAVYLLHRAICNAGAHVGGDPDRRSEPASLLSPDPCRIPGVQAATLRLPHSVDARLSGGKPFPFCFSAAENDDALRGIGCAVAVEQPILLLRYRSTSLCAYFCLHHHHAAGVATCHKGRKAMARFVNPDLRRLRITAQPRIRGLCTRCFLAGGSGSLLLAAQARLGPV